MSVHEIAYGPTRRKPPAPRSTDARADGRRPVLFLAHRLPYPPDKGDRIRSFHLLSAMASRVPVHLASLADEPVEPSAVAALESICTRVEVVRLGRVGRWSRASVALATGRTVTEAAFRSESLARTIAGWASRTGYRAAVASASSMVPYLRLAPLRDVPAVVDLVDVDSQKWHDYASASRSPRSWIYHREGRRLRALEAGLPDWAHAITLVSRDEAALYQTFRPSEKVHAVTNGVDLQYFHPSATAEESGLVFVGTLDYRPNVDAALWFCRLVWPVIRARYPECTLDLVGRQPSREVQALAALPGVRVVGRVPDVRPYVARAALAIAPLRIARGIQNKVLEAMAMGKAVVTSPEALNGLEARPGRDLHLADSPESWVAAVSSLLDDPEGRRRLGQSAREFVEEHHLWDRCLSPFLDLLGLGDGHEAPDDGRDGAGGHGA